jgi:hypothetical protein
MAWLDVQPGIDPDVNFGQYYYAYTRGNTMDRTDGGRIMKPVSKTFVLAAFRDRCGGVAAAHALLGCWWEEGQDAS